MEFLVDLWMPILVGAIVLQVLSTVFWMILPHHFGDKKKLDIEDEVMELVRKHNVQPDNYFFPYTNAKSEQSSKEYQAKYAAGPSGILDVYPKMNIGINMAKTFLYFLGTVTVIAYITHTACPPAETTFMKVFQLAGAVGMLTYASSGMLSRIWFKARQLTEFIDGCAYGVVIGLVFAMLYKYAEIAS